MALSALLRLCMSGGTSWYVQFQTLVLVAQYAADLRVDGESFGMQLLHDGIVCWNMMHIVLCLEWLQGDCVGIIVVGDHDILVATAGVD